MAVRKVAPTKTNLLKLKQELELANEGYELLDQKRNILINELLNLVDQAVEMEENVEASLARAYESYQDAALRMGRLQTVHLSSSVNMETDIRLDIRRVMGVRLPVVDTSFTEHAPYFSFMGTSFAIDVALENFRESLKLMGRLAELKVSIMRLAREVKKTIRKVNALEKLAIPDLKDSVKFVQDRLEENERDMFVLMKMVKSRLEARQET